MTVEIVYCEGWDPATRAVVRPLPESVARDRDVEGDRYAFVLTGDRPLVLVEVCWAANHAAAWRFDEHGRRDRRLDLRRWPDGLRLREARQWDYDSPRTPEFHSGTPRWRIPYWAAVYRPDRDRHVASGGWSGPDWKPAVTAWPVPVFGEWSAVLGELVGEWTGELVTARPAADPGEVTGPPPVVPWRPPVPLRPAHLEETFEPGARFDLDGAEVSVEVVPGGELQLPSGRLVVADPDPWLHEVGQFVDVAPPGTYPVWLSVVRFADDHDHTLVAAVAVVVSDAETVAWDHAWRPGESELLLGDGEFFGVGVDGGRVALVDASAAAVHAETVEDHHGSMSGRVHEVAGPGANLLAVETGWGEGSYPVWVGRDVEGRLTRWVVDFLVLAHSTPRWG